MTTPQSIYTTRYSILNSNEEALLTLLRLNQARFRIGSAQEILILSGVAGLCKCSTLVSPNCALAAFNASRIAKKTQLPMKSGGSPAQC